MVVAGLDGCLDLLTPEDAEAWLGDELKARRSFRFRTTTKAMLRWCSGCPPVSGRIQVQAATDAVSWLCGAPHGDHQIDFGRVLWGEAANTRRRFCCADGGKARGLFHLRIT